MSIFFSGGSASDSLDPCDQREAHLAVISKLASSPVPQRESEMIAAEVAAVQADFQERLREAEYAVF